jgi:hypothetical protein
MPDTSDLSIRLKVRHDDRLSKGVAATKGPPWDERVGIRIRNESPRYWWHAVCEQLTRLMSGTEK